MSFEALSVGRPRLVTSSAVRATLLLHLGLEHVASTVEQLVPHCPLVFTQWTPVAVVEFLDELERPASGRDVPADHVVVDSLSDVVVMRIGERVHRFSQQQIGMPHQLMERVEVSASPLDAFERLGHLAHRGHRGVVHTVGSPMRR